MELSLVSTATAHPAAFSLGALYPSGVTFVRRALARLGVPAADVEDVAQDVFVTLHRKGTEFSSERAARAWLWAAARRHASNHRRSRARAAAREPAWSPAEPALPDLAVQQREAAAIVEDFAAGLPQPARAVFELSEIDGLAVPRVAERLGLKLDTTYSHVRRVRSRFARSVAIVLGVLLLLAAMLRATCSAGVPDDGERIAVRRAAHVAG